MASYRVTRCICQNRMFDEIKSYSESQDITSVDELQEIDYCCNSCGFCIPYVKAMLETGKTEFKSGEPHNK